MSGPASGSGAFVSVLSSLITYSYQNLEFHMDYQIDIKDDIGNFSCNGRYFTDFAASPS